MSLFNTLANVGDAMTYGSRRRYRGYRGYDPGYVAGPGSSAMGWVIVGLFVLVFVFIIISMVASGYRSAKAMSQPKPIATRPPVVDQPKPAVVQPPLEDQPKPPIVKSPFCNTWRR